MSPSQQVKFGGTTGAVRVSGVAIGNFGPVKIAGLTYTAGPTPIDLSPITQNDVSVKLV